MKVGTAVDGFFFLFNLDLNFIKLDLNFLYFRNTVTQLHKGLDLFIEFS